MQSFFTVVRRLLNDEKLLDTLLGAEKPIWYEHLPTKRAAEAVVAVMIVKAIGGDVRVAEWLRKTGYGDKLDMDIENKPMPIPILGGIFSMEVNDSTEPIINPTGV